MANGVNVTFNAEGLDSLVAALGRYRDQRGLDDKEALYRGGRTLAYSAAYNTRRASSSAIATLLRRHVATVAFTPTGRRARGRGRRAINRPTEYGKVIVAWLLSTGRMYYRGFPRQANPRGYTPEVFEQMALTYINRRISSAAFIASGWKPAWNYFRERYHGSASDSAGSWRPTGPGLGGASEQMAAQDPNITLWNSSFTANERSESALSQYATEGLNAAVDWVTNDMNEYITRQLERRADELANEH